MRPIMTSHIEGYIFIFKTKLYLFILISSNIKKINTYIPLQN